MTPLDRQSWELSLTGLTKRYGPEVLFRDLSITVRPGETIRVAGPNGSGKTQLLKALSGFVALDAGAISLIRMNRRSSVSGTPFQRDAVVRFIPHQPGEMSGLGVALAAYSFSRNLSPRSLSSVERKVAMGYFAATQGQLERWVGEPLQASRPMSSLSVGQQKRLLLSAVLISSSPPAVLLVDEPLAGLDAEGIDVALELLRQARNNGTALLVAEHRGEIDALEFDRTVALPYPGEGVEPGLRPIPPPAEPMASRDTSTQTPVLTLDGVLAGYPGSEVECEFLQLAPGDLTVIRGANGAGKTGFLRGILGVGPTAVSGHISFSGKSRTSLLPDLRSGSIRFLDQNRSSFDLLRVSDALAAAIPRGCAAPPAIIRFQDQLDCSKLVSKLSSGNRAMLGLMQALAAAPALAILDEPFANVDGVNRARMMDLIQATRETSKTAFLIVEHSEFSAGATNTLWVTTAEPRGHSLLRSFAS